MICKFYAVKQEKRQAWDTVTILLAIERGMQEFNADEMGYTVILLVTGECTEFNGECSE